MAAGSPEPAREAAQQRALSRSVSSESMRRLDELRIDSYQPAPAWQREFSYTERRGTLDEIDYMTDEEEGSLHDASGSDAPRAELQAGRWALSMDSCC